MTPPRWLRLLARALVPQRNREFILGDLDELYGKAFAERGRLRAVAGYLRGAIASGVAQRFGGRPPRREARYSPDGGRGGMVRDTAADFRFALRTLRRRPRFTALVVVTLALGIGSTAAVYSMVNQLVLRPLAGAQNSWSAAYMQLGTPGQYVGLNLPDFDALREQATLLEGLASYGSTVPNVFVEGRRPVQVPMNTIYGDFFEVLGARASEGRLLSGDDTGLGENPLVVVISQSLRSRLFGPGDEVVGRALHMNGHPFEIVGVVAGGFRGPERGIEADAWVPHGALVPLVGFAPERMTSRQTTMHSQLLAHPAAGVEHDAVEAQVAEVIGRLAESDPEAAEYLSELRPTLYGGLHTPPLVRALTARTLRMMGWAVALMLAIACANVANLLLFRGLTRRGALATLRAFGATRGRIARQQAAESLLLSGLGAIAALAVAWLIMLPFRGEQLVRMPAFEGFAVDAQVLTFVMCTALAAALLFGALPAFVVGRFDLGSALGAGRTHDTGRLGWLRAALSSGQIALTLSLLVGGLLLVRTIANLRSLDTGVDIDGVVWLWVDSPGTSQPLDQHGVHRELLARVAAVPGVEGAALDVYGPHGSRFLGRVGLPGSTFDEDEPWESRPMMWQVTPGWFELFDVRLLGGRTFEDADWGVPPTDAVIVTASLATRLFGRTDVVGRTVLAGGGEPIERQIVGVVDDYRSLFDPEAPMDAFFVPFGSDRLSNIMVLARIAAPEGEALLRIRGAVESVFPDAAVPDPVPLAEVAEGIYSEEVLLGRFLGLLAGLGLLMSAIGLYGAIYFFVVANRKRELGIRVALGANRVRIAGLVGRMALGITVGGTAVGLLIAYALARVLQNRLFGVGPLDGATYVGAAALLASVAMLACVAPARSALRVDPVETLRAE